MMPEGWVLGVLQDILKCTGSEVRSLTLVAIEFNERKQSVWSIRGKCRHEEDDVIDSKVEV